MPGPRARVCDVCGEVRADVPAVCDDCQAADLKDKTKELEAELESFEAIARPFGWSLVSSRPVVAWIAEGITALRAQLEEARRESILRRQRAERLDAALLGMKHRDMADGQPCWCLLWPDEDPEPTLAKEGHGSHCIAAREALR